MGWKKVLLLSCLAPAFGGCNIAYYTAKNIFNEPYTLADQVLRHHDLRAEARDAWQEVRMQYPRCLFSCEFRDGFIDGFSDYLDRGGNAQPPAVPPKKYTRNHYLNPEGHALIHDYFLGFQYGVDVALATKQRQYLTVPVLLQDRSMGAPKFTVNRPEPPKGEALPKPKRLETMGPQDDPAAPANTAVPNRPSVVSGNAAAPAVPLGPTKFTRSDETQLVEVSVSDKLPPIKVPVGGVDPATAKQLVPFPAPPMGVPMLPDGVPTPSVLDDLPMVQSSHWPPAAKSDSPAKPAVPEAMAKPAPGGRR